MNKHTLMKIFRISRRQMGITGAMLLLMAVSATAQQASTTPTDPVERPVGKFGQPLGGGWSLSGSLQASQGFDDNLFPDLGGRVSDTASRFSGLMSASWMSRHTQFEAHYSPEYAMYQRFESLNSLSHNYSQSLSQAISATTDVIWTLNVRKSPSRSGLPFSSVNFGDVLDATSNIAATDPQRNLFATNSTLTVNHRFTARDRFHVTVMSGYTRNTTDDSAAIFQSQKSYTARSSVGFDHDVDASRSFGVEASSDYFGFLDPGSHQTFYVAKARFTQMLPGRFKLSVGGGPSFALRQDLGGGSPDVLTSYAFDVALARSDKHQGVNVMFSRGLQFGLLQQAVSTYSGGAQYNRNLGQKWTALAGFNYSRSQQVTNNGTSDNYGLTGELGYRVARGWKTTLNYSYELRQSDFATGLRDFDRNRVSIGLVKEFGTFARF